MNSIKVCEYSRSRSFHDDLILQDQASGERSQDHWSSGFKYHFQCFRKLAEIPSKQGENQLLLKYMILFLILTLFSSSITITQYKNMKYPIRNFKNYNFTQWIPKYPIKPKRGG